jgi:hypothetical protein
MTHIHMNNNRSKHKICVQAMIPDQISGTPIEFRRKMCKNVPFSRTKVAENIMDTGFPQFGDYTKKGFWCVIFPLEKTHEAESSIFQQ